MGAMCPYDTTYRTLFGARKSIRYHQRRRAFFEAAHTIAVSLQVIAGSTAVAAIMGNVSGSESGWGWGAGLAATAAVLAALDLAFGVSRRATAHASLAQQFAQLEREMVPHEHDGTVSAETATAFRQRRLEIEESEPPKLRAIDLLCHNELVISTYRHDKIYPVVWWKRWVGHVWDVEVDDSLESARKVSALDAPGIAVK